MWDVKQTTQIEGCFKYFSFKGKIRNRGKKIRPSSIRLPFFNLCVTSGPPDQFDRVLFHVKSSEFRLMNKLKYNMAETFLNFNSRSMKSIDFATVEK